MSKLECPFCHKELDTGNYFVHCHDPHCNITAEMEGTEEMWEALIRAHNALNFAISTLTVISEGCVIEHSVVGHEDDNKIKLAKIALDRIKTITKGGDNE